MALTGFATWNPTPESELLLQQIASVLEDYKDFLPLTGRQIFYRLVGAYGLEKSENAANRVYNVLGRGRRAGAIPFHVIRDGGGQKAIPQTYDDAQDFWDEVRDDRQHFVRDRQAGQPVYVELFCEAPGMMLQLQRVAFDYSVPVYGTRGFAGLSVIAEIAKRALRRDRPTVLIQIGDYDPSGESIFESIAADAGDFVAQIVGTLTRSPASGRALADRLGLSKSDVQRLVDVLGAGGVPPDLRAVRGLLTWEQVEEFELETAPDKPGNPHGHNWVGETAQAEAMPPDLLARVVREAIEEELDMDVYRAEVAREEADREEIDAVLEDVP